MVWPYNNSGSFLRPLVELIIMASPKKQCFFCLIPLLVVQVARCRPGKEWAIFWACCIYNFHFILAGGKGIVVEDG